ncbi:MAG: GGDEF domain-containing protein, partial [Solirubrobacterales bacterium]|nr:GGDEF domain-containing protein [Solirubrobacterales bacterium]
MATLGIAAALVDTLASRGRRTASDLSAIASERSELAHRLERVARTDELTGLPNRRGWEEELGREIARSKRTAEPLCVALIDLDNFKRFNDARGHLAGDELLRKLAPAWHSHLRESDLLIRYGGEEFALALPDCELADAEVLLQRLRSSVPEGETCSAGVARWNRR